MTIDARGNCTGCGRHCDGQFCQHCDTATITMPEAVYRKLTGIDILVSGCGECVFRHGNNCRVGCVGYVYPVMKAETPDACPLLQGPIKVGLIPPPL